MTPGVEGHGQGRGGLGSLRAKVALSAIGRNNPQRAAAACDGGQACRVSQWLSPSAVACVTAPSTRIVLQNPQARLPLAGWIVDWVGNPGRELRWDCAAQSQCAAGASAAPRHFALGMIDIFLPICKHALLDHFTKPLRLGSLLKSSYRNPLSPNLMPKTPDPKP